MLGFIQEHLAEDLKPTYLRQSVRYREAAAIGLPITHYLPTSEQASAFSSLAQDMHL